MRYLSMVILCLIAFAGKAQKAVGVQFEQDLSWVQIKEKAKKENKYIFLDGYTTWCGPCKAMAKNIFPLQEAGDFFNTKFINVAVQFDVTDHDNAYVKSWYEDAKAMEKMYKVDAYPTYLFFNPDGELVHFIKGASTTAADFIEKAKPALDPKTQYLTLKRQYQEGNRDSVFVLNLIYTAEATYDLSARDTFINGYLDKQKDLLTPRNLGFIAKATTKSTDIGFNVLRKHPDLVDAVAGKGKSNAVIKNIAFDEVVLPIIRANGKKTNMGGGMVIYSGDVQHNVDWVDIKKKLDVDYVDLSDQIILVSKPLYYQFLDDWKGFSNAVSLYAADHKNLDRDELNRYAGIIHTYTTDKENAEVALKWTEQVLSAPYKDKAWYLLNHSYLLYRVGQKEKAIKVMQEYIQLAAPADEYFVKELEKMKKGEKLP